jgi:hypothetical protein
VKRVAVGGLMAAMMVCAVHAASAQTSRTRSAAPGETTAVNGVARDARFPYAGVWRGVRTMPVGTGEIGFRFMVEQGHYSGRTLHPDGSTAPQNNLAATARGLTWESPNSGGGTWVYSVRLAGPDSMVGTLVLRDPPPNLTPAPRGTLVLIRQPAPTSSNSK